MALVSFYSIIPHSSFTSILKPKKSGQFLTLRFPQYYGDDNCSVKKITCRGTASYTSGITDYDLYELLGVDRSCDQSEIKKAYRALQKRCHPDIAGTEGHDMAILLNEVYTILSDPVTRYTYDKEQVKLSEFQGYTGKPLYSAWFGSENENRAVFVDEIKCVGCLKCALFANKTFAVESAYGRARVVAQWADPEDKILDAMKTCPVDCISMVERSDLPALEFLMSKQPRERVRMSVGNTVGVRIPDVFSEINKFQKKYKEMREKASRKRTQGIDLQQESQFSAIQRIRSISNWWYWQPINTATGVTGESLSLTVILKEHREPRTERLKEAAARHRKRVATESTQASVRYKQNDEYWKPLLILPSSSTTNTVNYSSSAATAKKATLHGDGIGTNIPETKMRKGSKINIMVPGIMAVISATIIGYTGAEVERSGLQEHIYGTAALDVVNSLELQVLLAGITWFMMGITIQLLVEALRSRFFQR